MGSGTDPVTSAWLPDTLIIAQLMEHSVLTAVSAPLLLVIEEVNMAQHPFSVGSTYRNRDGDYEVISIREPKMRIRYASGRELEADIAQQERTWRNMQLDDNVPAPAAPASTRSASSRAPVRARVGQRGRDFRGLQDHDFQRGTAGTTWRRKESLGGLLAEMMSQATSHDCQHYAIFRRSELHVAQPERYTVDNKPSQAKFVFE
jgi:hypothetical protein